MLLWSVLLIGCAGEEEKPDRSTRTEILAACGDGAIDLTEQCDNGADNSDTAPDACRASCLLPACGDAVVDGGEGCDDGARRGGDGCDPGCQPESGAPEAEPNDDPAAASPVTDGAQVSGALPAGDTDCFVIAIPACGAIQAIQTSGCEYGLILDVYNPDGERVAAGATGETGCAALDPAEEPGARWLEAGDWTICAAALNHADVAGYTLEFSTPDPVAAGLPTTGKDLDSDSTPDSCDADIDQDGIDNADDNCPEVSNGPATPAPALDAEGDIEDWLSNGPFTTGQSSGSCRPSADLFVGEDQPLVALPGDIAGGNAWLIADIPGGLFDLLPFYGGVPAPREAYALSYLYSDAARTLTLSVGADDGVFAWWNGAMVLDISSCQGVNRDQFQAEVEVIAGWNTLLLKVYDQGGGWGLIARLLGADGAPVTDLQPSLHPDEVWTPDQSDQDGDGIGDACDR